MEKYIHRMYILQGSLCCVKLGKQQTKKCGEKVEAIRSLYRVGKSQVVTYKTEFCNQETEVDKIAVELSTTELRGETLVMSACSA